MVDLASACLVGVKCRYDGESKTDAELLRLFQIGGVIPVCPELLGGFPAPRPRMEIESGDAGGAGRADGKNVLEGRAKVIDQNARDCTGAMVEGALKTVAVAQSVKPVKIYLKSKSPSCGAGGGMGESGILGVAAAALLKAGFNLINIE